MDEQQNKGLEHESAVSESTESKRTKGGTLTFFKQVFFGLCYALFGYFSGGVTLPFGARPLGIAVLCGSDRRIFYLYAGLCVSAWAQSDRILLIGIYSAILLIRLLARFVLDPPWTAEEAGEAGEKTVGEIYPILFAEHTSLRMASACLGVFALGLYHLIEGGFLYYDLYGTILSVLAAPTTVLLLSGLFTQEANVGTARRTVGTITLVAVLVLGLGTFRLWGISLAALACMLFTLWVTRKQGAVVGMIAGTLTGLAVSVELAPTFAFAALAAGLLFPVSSALALSAAFAASVAWGIYVSGLGILNGLLSALIASTVLFFVWDKLFASEKEDKETQIRMEDSENTACLPLSDAERWELRAFDTQTRMKRLCESFSSLSTMLAEVARLMQTPTSADLRRICDRAFEDSCASCGEKGKCWGEQYRTTSAEVGALSAALHRDGRLEMSHAPQSLRARCTRLPDVLEEINHNALAEKKQMLLGDRTEIFALDYGAISELLATSMVAQEQEGAFDEALAETICTALTDAALPIVRVGVYGTHQRRVHLEAASCDALREKKEEICETVRRVCPFPLTDGVISDERGTVLALCEQPPFTVAFAQRTLLAEGEESYCGDTVGSFHSDDGRFFSLISDGMGSGREAAMTSSVSGAYLRKMIDAGCPCEMAVRMLNGFLRNRGSGSLHECSATVDLMELDLMLGKASFYKNGAAPTYVFRNGGIIKLRSRTVPVGILQESDTRRIGFDLTAGDMVVMVSDGVTQGKEECPWLFDLLRNQGAEVSCDRIADLVVKYAKNEGATDDLSVIVVKLS